MYPKARWYPNHCKLNFKIIFVVNTFFVLVDLEIVIWHCSITYPIILAFCLKVELLNEEKLTFGKLLIYKA